MLIAGYSWNTFQGTASKEHTVFTLILSFYSTVYFWYRWFAISNNEWYPAIVHKSNNKISSSGDFIVKVVKNRF